LPVKGDDDEVGQRFVTAREAPVERGHGDASVAGDRPQGSLTADRSVLPLSDHEPSGHFFGVIGGGVACVRWRGRAGYTRYDRRPILGYQPALNTAAGEGPTMAVP
jgi:hypothetical protein